MKLNLCTLWRKRSRSQDLSQTRVSISQMRVSISHMRVSILQMRVSIKVFKYKELQKATKDFSDALGSGCFGSAHRGMLPDSNLVAVKKIVESRYVDFEGVRGLLNCILDSMQHINVVPLIGICDEGGERILVYEYMPRRSLDLHLFQQPNDKEINTQVVLDWNRRYQIALGTARGLAHLHRKCRFLAYLLHAKGCSSYRHFNIKPENIILDSEFCAKLTDYLLWLFWDFDEYCGILTTSTSTTRSYIAPEVLSKERALINYNSDVHSYGMVLFEMISGIRNSENGETPKSFPTRVASLIRDESGHDILSVLDSRLDRNADEEEVLRLCKVACWCIHDDPQHRPYMEQVVGVLEGVIDDKHCEIAFN